MTKYYSQKYFIFSPNQPSFIETITIYIHTQRIIKHSLKKRLYWNWLAQYILETVIQRIVSEISVFCNSSAGDVTHRLSFLLQAEVSGKCDESIVCLRPCNSLRREQLLLRREPRTLEGKRYYFSYPYSNPTSHIISCTASESCPAKLEHFVCMRIAGKLPVNYFLPLSARRLLR